MSDSKAGGGAIYPRLCIAYFMEFAIWASWAGALGAYAGGVLKMSGWEIGWLYAAIPLGAVISPLFIGPIADRFFSAQKVVSLLHFIGGACLLLCGYLCSTWEPGKASFPIMMTLILLSGVCFMPTIALINSIVFKNLPDVSKAPYVFVFGTIGWICITLFIAAFCEGADKHYFFYCGGGVSILLALYSLTLPDTPPKGAPAPGEKSDALGLGALKLFKDPSFAIFALCAFLASVVGSNYFFPSQVLFLTQRDYPSPLALTTLNQFSEIAFMTALPFCIAKFGLKKVIVLGMSAWAIRYFCFAQPAFGFAIFGLFLHGIGYSFLYSASYMYADKKAPPELRASVQSMMAFLLLGVGQVLGSTMFGYVHDKHAAPVVPNMTVAASEDPVSLPFWRDPAMKDSAWRYLDLSATVKGIMGIVPPEQQDFVADFKLEDGTLTKEKIEAYDGPLVYGGVTYDKESLEKVFDRVTEATKAEKGEVKRTQWLSAQSANWSVIWLVGSIWAAVFCVAFFVLGKDPEDFGKGESPKEIEDELVKDGADHPASG